ncbi:MAG: glycosyltransferase, partial [Clostridia bacterium]|nr:glycosyltransferase [Clostridia bacterium]
MKIVAIIPAYNEEKTIGAVLSALKETSLINQILVVSDGSED